MELRTRALQALSIPEPAAKCAAVHELAAMSGTLAIAAQAPSFEAPLPGRPPRPELVHPSKVPQRSPTRPEGLAALLHAIAHIEFNAINLALDAVWRFDGMPREYYLDWMRIADEEAHHFAMVCAVLAELDCTYGDLPAHDGLWALCLKTADDVLARMALVPRTMEARGLDANPQIQAKLRRVDSPQARHAVGALDVILRDEIGHVAVGNHWYAWCCAQRGLDPVAHYAELAQRYGAPRVHPPFNLEARKLAGFSEAELKALAA